MSQKNKEVLITGTVAFDEIETPNGSSGKIIGGAGTYIALAASIFSKRISLISVIGDDFLEVVFLFLLSDSSIGSGTTTGDFSLSGP